MKKEKTAKGLWDTSQAEWKKQNTLLASNLRRCLEKAAFGRGFAFGMEPDSPTPMQCPTEPGAVFSFFISSTKACLSTETRKAAAVGRSQFPFSAPVFVLQGSEDCPLRSDPEGIAKRRAAS
ncbi:hypothetical protein [Brevibacillus borstelensis]|uniref:hypothetical protein n=1 Tax=Brevibacillus borstelensis TaxID=45462 RepID=UPI0030BCD66B